MWKSPSTTRKPSTALATHVLRQMGNRRLLQALKSCKFGAAVVSKATAALNEYVKEWDAKFKRPRKRPSRQIHRLDFTILVGGPDGRQTRYPDDGRGRKGQRGATCALVPL